MSKKLICITVICFVVILLTGCTLPYGEPTEHTFLQSRDDVVKVEICTNSEPYSWPIGQNVSSLGNLAELSAEEIDHFWNDLSNFPALDASVHREGCGDLLFVVSYANGQKELVGYGKVGVLNADGTFAGYRHYVLEDRELLANLFAKYADIGVLKKESKSFCAFYKAESDPLFWG